MYQFLRNSYHGKGGIKEMLIIALPMVASYACDVVMQFTDRIYMARVSPEAMNAVLGGGLTAILLSFFFVGILSFSNSLVAQYFGAEQKDKSAKVLTQSLILSVLAYPLILLMRPLGHLFFEFMKIPPGQLHYQTQYFDILVYGMLVVLMRTALSSFFTGIGKTNIVMIATVITMVVNIGFNYVLVFGKFGFPAMGIQGAALGTVLAGGVGMLIELYAYFRKSIRDEFQVLKAFRFDWAIMKKLLYFGTPQGVEMFVNMTAFTALIFIFQSQGSVIATATTITFNWDYLSFIPLIGIEIAVMSLVGRYMGARDTVSASRSAYSGLMAASIYSFTNMLLFVFIPTVLVNVFRSSEDSLVFAQAAPIAVRMIQLAALYLLFDAIMLCFVGVLRGAGDTYWTMWASMIMNWTMTISAYVMFTYFKLDVITVWTTVIVIIILFAVVLYLRFRSGKWKNIHMID